MSSTYDEPEGVKDAQAFAENIAAVTSELSESIAGVEEEKWPGGYRFEKFNGFPGWWTFCATAGTIFHQQFEGKLEEEQDGWLDLVSGFARAVWDKVDEAKGPISDVDIRVIAKFIYIDTYNVPCSECGRKDVELHFNNRCGYCGIGKKGKALEEAAS